MLSLKLTLNKITALVRGVTCTYIEVPRSTNPSNIPFGRSLRPSNEETTQCSIRCSSITLQCSIFCCKCPTMPTWNLEFEKCKLEIRCPPSASIYQPYKPQRFPLMLIATIVQAALVCSNHNRRNLAGQTEDLVVQLPRGLPSRLQLLLRGTGPSLFFFFFFFFYNSFAYVQARKHKQQNKVC